MFSDSEKSIQPLPIENLLRDCSVIIFDWDGVVANTEEDIWNPTREAVLASYGKTITLEEQVGCQGQKIAFYLKEKWGLPDTVEAIEQLIKETKAKIMTEREVKPIPEAVEFIKKINELGYQIAVASSSDVETIKRQSDQFGVVGCFQEILGYEHTVAGKNKKSLFTQAALRLGERDPDRCLVIEDASSGVALAKDTGMHCIAVPRPYRRETFEKADFIIPSLRSINLGFIPPRSR